MLLIVPTLAQQVAVCRATRKLHGANLGALCNSLLTNPAEKAEQILATNLHAPFDTPIEEVLLSQARLRASRCALTRAALEISGRLPLTFIGTRTDISKDYTLLEVEDGKIGLCMPGSNLLGDVWEEIRDGENDRLKEPFHVVCTTAEKPFFEHSPAIVHVADDTMQKLSFFENYRFAGSCMAVIVTLGKAERSSETMEGLFDQLLAAIQKVPHLQAVILPPPHIQTDAYAYQAKQLRLNFPETYNVTDSGGSLLQVGRYGAHADRRYVNGDKWDKDGLLTLKAYLVQVLGHQWLRNIPKANASFPLRQLHQLQLESPGLAPESQPSTSVRPHDTRHHSTQHDARLHSTRGGAINRRATSSRPGPRSTNANDPQLLHDIISSLQPGQQTRFKQTNFKRRK